MEAPLRHGMGILAHGHGPEARDTKNMGKDAMTKRCLPLTESPSLR
jgi:hypothetical protein